MKLDILIWGPIIPLLLVFVAGELGKSYSVGAALRVGSLSIASKFSAAGSATANDIKREKDNVPADQAAQGAAAGDQGTATGGEIAGEIELPASLTVKDFDKFTSAQLTLVEFYSPYCSHCKTLAPTWEKTYKSFHSEMVKLNIMMRQVNCIENGDLCEREDISSYPNLRLYMPERDAEGKDIPGKLKFVGSFPRSLERTEENFKEYLKNAAVEYDTGNLDLPSTSVTLDVDQMLDIAVGEIDKPYFVAFFPASDRQWLVSDTSQKKNLFSNYCYDCLDYKLMWGKLSNLISSKVKLGNLNCMSHPNLCESLGMKKLTSETYPVPKFAMFLPKKAGAIRFDFNGAINLNELKSFAVELHENSQYDPVTSFGLAEAMDYKLSLPSKPFDKLPLKNRIGVIFHYDPKTVANEDKDILPYLLQYVTESPFHINLYTGNTKKLVLTFEDQYKGLVDFINYDKDVPRKEFNREMYLAQTISSKPTIYVVKDNTLFTSVYQSFAPEDIRNQNKIKKFIEQNQFPLYQELTLRLFPYYFNNNGGKKSNNDKVVITFIDSSDEVGTSEALYKISLSAHDYHNTKGEYHFGQIKKRREAKDKKVEALRRKNAKSLDIVDEMGESIPHSFDKDDVLFTFIDLAKPGYKHKGWNFNKDNYKPGETLVVSKNGRYYYDTNISGNKLQNDPREVMPVLKYLLNKDLIEKPRKVKLSRKLIGSPYGGPLKFMDFVHYYGILGYVVFLAGVYKLMTFIPKGFLKSYKPLKALGPHKSTGPHRSTGPHQGILGNFEKVD